MAVSPLMMALDENDSMNRNAIGTRKKTISQKVAGVAKVKNTFR
jgi:hypothetical protein